LRNYLAACSNPLDTLLVRILQARKKYHRLVNRFLDQEFVGAIIRTLHASITASSGGNHESPK
jgi:hypothetical protein